MNTFQLGVCVDTIDAALAASRTGINTLQLCSSLVLGGLTPGLSLIELTKELIELPLHVLIRPRFGDFLYSPLELEQMKRDVVLCKKHMVDGIVIGALTADGKLDTYMLRTLIDLAGDMTISLGRCFDCCVDPYAALETAIELGCHNILTSGHKTSPLDGCSLIADLIQRAGSRIRIIPSGDIDAASLKHLISHTSATHFVVSATETTPSLMTHKNPDISFLHTPIDEQVHLEINETKLVALKKQLEAVSSTN